MYGSRYQNIQDANVIPELKFEDGKTPADIMNRLTSLKNHNFASDLISENRTTTNGAIIGLVSGFLIALWFKKNKFAFAFAGTLSGGLVGYTINTIQHYNQNRLLKTQKENTNTVKNGSS